MSSMPIGELVSDRFEIRRLLGTGGAGLVYEARDRMLDTTVALKVLRTDLGSASGMDSRLRSEIRLARQVRHRNVCGIHEYGEQGSLRYIVMELIEGEDLASVIKAHGRLPTEEAFEASIQSAEGLQAIHEAGIIHRDLKTANIMRDSRGQIRLMDFGIARPADIGGATRLTVAGQMVGTPDYMSPEQIRGDPLDFRSDIYSLGIVIFELFTGSEPFHGTTPIATVLRHLQEAPPLHGAEAAPIPRPMIVVLERALAKDRDARYATAGDLLEDIRQARQQSRASLPRTDAANSTPAPVASDARALPLAALVPEGRASPQASRPHPVPIVTGANSPGRDGTIVTPSPWAGAPREARSSSSPQRTLARHRIVFGRPGWLLAGVAGVIALVVAIRREGQVATPTVAPRPLATPGEMTKALALETPSMQRTASASSPSPPSSRSSSPPSRELRADLSALDRMAARDPQKAMDEVLALVRQFPTDPVLTARLGAYKEVLARNLVDRGRESLARAERSPSMELYEQAAKDFAAALDASPGNLQARDGLSSAIRGQERTRIQVLGATFVQEETVFRPPPDSATPPGLGSPPPGFAVKSALVPVAQARILIEIEPRQLRAGDEFVLRYYVYAASASPLFITEASIVNVAGTNASTGGRIEPRTRSVPPGERVLVLESRDVWRLDMATAWKSTLHVSLRDGGLYSSTLHTRQ